MIDLPPDIRPEVKAAVDFITQALDEEGVRHVAEYDEGVVSFAAIDKNGYENLGLVAWDHDHGKVAFIAHDQSTLSHDIKEGVDEYDSKHWWDCKGGDVFALHLVGEVRQIVGRERERILKKPLDKVGQNGRVRGL